jgi:hypothetical protein
MTWDESLIVTLFDYRAVYGNVPDALFFVNIQQRASFPFKRVFVFRTH